MAKFGLRRVLRLRWFLYAALVVYFGVQALRKWMSDEPPPPASDEPLGPGGIKPTRYYTLPDGQKAPIYEVTPEEAERHFGVKPSTEAAAAKPEPAAPPPPAEARGSGASTGSAP